MKSYATPILLIAAVLTLALLLGATTRTGSSRAEAHLRPPSSPASGAHDRIINRHTTRAACRHLYGDDPRELGGCLAAATR
jgi:hypothetical protein